MISPTMHTRWHSVCVCVCLWTLSNFKFWGGILKLSELDSLSNFTRGGILKLSELDSLSNFTRGGHSEAIRTGLPAKFGGVFWNFGFGLREKSWEFGWGGGWGGILNFRIGVFCRIWTKISTTPTGRCITDSLSHTTYVETNKPHSFGHKPYKLS